MIIYKVTNTINGKCYIGQTIQTLKRRITRHLHDVEFGSSAYYHNAIRKHGWDNFICDVIDTGCQTKDELNEMEFHYIKQYKSHYTENGYNITWGGDGNSLYGSDNPMYGRKRTDEEKELMSKNRKRKCTGEDNAMCRPEMRQWFKKNNPMNNKESRDKMADKISANWMVTDPHGNELTIRNLKKHCRDNKIPYHKVRNSIDGWLCKKL